MKMKADSVGSKVEVKLKVEAILGSHQSIPAQEESLGRGGRTS